MQGRNLENTGWAVFIASTAASLGLLQFEGPSWAVNLALGFAIAISFPLMFWVLRRKWRGG